MCHYLRRGGRGVHTIPRSRKSHLTICRGNSSQIPRKEWNERYWSIVTWSEVCLCLWKIKYESMQRHRHCTHRSLLYKYVQTTYLDRLLGFCDISSTFFGYQEHMFNCFCISDIISCTALVVIDDQCPWVMVVLIWQEIIA